MLLRQLRNVQQLEGDTPHYDRALASTYDNSYTSLDRCLVKRVELTRQHQFRVSILARQSKGDVLALGALGPNAKPKANGKVRVKGRAAPTVETLQAAGREPLAKAAPQHIRVSVFVLENMGLFKERVPVRASQSSS